MIPRQARLMQYGAAVLFPAILAGCNLEVNVNLADSRAEENEFVAIEARAATPAPPVAPVAPPAVAIAPTPEPVLADVDVDVVVRDALWRPERVPTPDEAQPSSSEVCQEPMFTPFTEAPGIRNRGDVLAAVGDAYPRHVREMGVGGTAYLYFCIDNDGRVMNVLVDKSSGNAALDEAALNVAEVYRFTSAKKQGADVTVWVSVPVTFQIR